VVIWGIPWSFAVKFTVINANGVPSLGFILMFLPRINLLPQMSALNQKWLAHIPLLINGLIS